ncbi:MAG: helix-turn-helix transcriptional regulator [Sphingomonadales bacterium]
MVRSLVHDSARLLGAILKDHRRAKGINQVALAAALGKPQSFVSKVESGERRLDVFEFIVLVRALEIDANALMIELSEALRAR